MNKYEKIENLLEKANKNIERWRKFFLDNQNFFNTHNFKLYDVSYYIYDKMKNEFPLTYKKYENSIFSEFCEYEFSFFKSENNINMCSYIGRTSSFYIVPTELGKNVHYYDCADFIQLIYYYIEDLQTAYNCDYFRFCDNSNKLEFVFDTDQNNFVYKLICDDRLDDIENLLTTIIEFNIEDFYSEALTFYNNLYDFKNNQVEYFKCYIEDLETILEKELENENNKKHLLRNIIHFYVDKNNNLLAKDLQVINEILEKLGGE